MVTKPIMPDELSKSESCFFGIIFFAANQKPLILKYTFGAESMDLKIGWSPKFPNYTFRNTLSQLPLL